jgi:hypothetical protein
MTKMWEVNCVWVKDFCGMQGHRKLYRILGFVLIFVFLQAQTCDQVLNRFGWDTNLDCSLVQITSLTQDANGNVSIRWSNWGDEFRIRLFYERGLIFQDYYFYPSDSASFRIDWQSLQGSSNEVSLELDARNQGSSHPCTISRSLQRPVPATPSPSMVCDNLRLTSPLGGLANGEVTFYWDALEGAVGYHINIYDRGVSLAGWDAPTGQTNLVGNVSSAAIGGESPLTVELIASDNAGNTCSQRYEIAREAAPAQAAPASATRCSGGTPSPGSC